MSDVLQAGAIFANRYKILHRIAAGGMGAVYEVVHIETNRRRALKVMHPNVLQNDDMRARFKLEARIAADVESEFIVDVFDAGIDEATQMPFLVMELLRGEELGKRLKRLGSLPPADVTQYLYQTALALDKTHKALIVHRDLKPENLFLTEREDGLPRVKVLDFGIAKLIAEGGTGGGAPTQSIGTPLYMSPEQFNTSLKLSGASDIFSLGMMAYTLLVGRAYWAEEGKAKNVYALIAAAAYGPSEPASVRAGALGVCLSSEFDAWFAKVTARSASDRFPTATAAVRALAEVLGTLPAIGLSPAQSGMSLAPAAIMESGPQRQVLASSSDPVAPSAPIPASEAGLGGAAPAPGPGAHAAPGSAAMASRLGQSSSPGTVQLQTADVMALEGDAPPQASARAPFPSSGPETTSPGASVTRPVPKERSKGGLLVTLFGAVLVAGLLGYVLASQGRSISAAASNGTVTSQPPTAMPVGSPSMPSIANSAPTLKTEIPMPSASVPPVTTASAPPLGPSASSTSIPIRPAGSAGRNAGRANQQDPDVGF